MNKVLERMVIELVTFTLVDRHLGEHRQGRAGGSSEKLVWQTIVNLSNIGVANDRKS